MTEIYLLQVLDDIYQYHLPPNRRIPPLLWTRVRSDLPGYLADCEADGVCVINWYHKQFKIAAKQRYFISKEEVLYFHSYMADYFLGGDRETMMRYLFAFSRDVWRRHQEAIPIHGDTEAHVQTEEQRLLC